MKPPRVFRLFLKDQESINFYTIAGVESALLTFYAVYVLASHFIQFHEDSSLVGQSCVSPDSAEYVWRIAATSIAVPLIIEFILDFAVSFLYPAISQATDGKHHALEDRLGHGILVASLLPVSFVVIWLFGPAICNFRDAFVSIGHSMVVCGVLGKLETFSSDIWHQSDAIVVLTLFFGAQVSLLSGIRVVDGVVTYTSTALQVACALKLLSTLIFLTSSRNIQLVFQEIDEKQANFFVTRKYLCSTLFLGLALFMFASTYFCYQAYVNLPQPVEILSTRIMVTIAGVIVTAILPGRIMRRGLQAVQQTAAIQREMSYKKTFVRYISHEIRSPLSNTSLGLDCLLDALKSDRRLNRAELVDISRDCKMTCNSALQTLNDLLLFDKIESQMLALERTTVMSYHYLTQYTAFYGRQLQAAGVGYNVDIDVHLTHMYLDVDTLKMEQVIRNYISNAMKFTKAPGSITVRAKLTSYDQSTLLRHHQEKMAKSSVPTNLSIAAIEQLQMHASTPVVRFEVIDSGAGISAENQKKLFQQYMQVDANKLQGGKGSGLGLWICKTIVEMHGGCVGAFSPGEGQGSTFFFELPLKERMSSSTFVPSPEMPTVASSTPSNEVKSSVRGGRINSQSPEGVEAADGPQLRPRLRSQRRHSSSPNVLPPLSGAASTNGGPIPTNSQSFAAALPAVGVASSRSRVDFEDPVGKVQRASSMSASTMSPHLRSAVATSESVSSSRSNSRLPSPNLPTAASTRSRILRNQSPSVEAPAPSAGIAAKASLNSRSDGDQDKRDTGDDETCSVLSNESPHDHPVPRILTSCLSSQFNVRRDQLLRTWTQRQNWTVLVADDSIICRKLMVRLLQPYATTILQARDGLEAIEIATNHPDPIDLIFVDHYMPTLAGPETIHKLRTDVRFDGLILAVSGAMSKEEQEALLTAGADISLGKPFDVRSFQSIIFDSVAASP